MKRVLCLVSFLLISVLFHSCEKEENFDESLLIGKWKPVSGTSLYYRYDSNHKGVTWNPSPEVDQQEDEGQAFTWQLVKSDLEQIHIMEIGGAGIPKNYTVTELTETTLRYKDSFSSYSFSKIK
jgi:hypothetical protein